MPVEEEIWPKPTYDTILPEASAPTEDEPPGDSKSQPSTKDANLQEPSPSDLEQLQRAPSGPAYSIFNKHQKNFIVCKLRFRSDLRL